MEKKEKSSFTQKKKKVRKETIFLISIVMLIILMDQILKIWIQKVGEVSVIPGILNFKVSQNTSAAYGIGSNSTIMYVLTNVVILGVIFIFITTQNEFVDRKFKVFLSFILAGGISNVIDKIGRGYVTEWIDVKQVMNLPVLNLADIFVMVGWIAIVAIFASFTVKEWRNKKTVNCLKDEDKQQDKK